MSHQELSPTSPDSKQTARVTISSLNSESEDSDTK